MPWPVHPTGFFGARGDSDTYRIERSLRFNSADSAYLNRTPAGAGNRKTWTWSGWVKRGILGTAQTLFSCGTAANDTGNMAIAFLQSTNLDSLRIHGYATNFRVTTMQFRDTSAWYHIVVAIDSTNATASNRIKMYVNGVEITSFLTSNDLTLNTDYGINQALQHGIGRYEDTASSYFNGYLTEINFIDGQALTPSSFGETDAITGRWKAKAYSGTYGTNGFYLKFADNSGTTSTTLGKDSSPNGNNWTPNNFSVTAGTGNDSLVDSPTNYGTDTGLGGEVRGNYAILNPLTGNSTPIDGNLRPNDDGTAISTIGMSSGRWYCEMTVVAVGTTSDLGIHTGTNFNTYVGSTATGYSYSDSGQKFNNASGSAYGASYTTGDIIGCAFDADAGTLVFYKNGTSQGTAFTGLTGGPYFFGIYGRSSATANNVYINFGQRPFANAAPSGFKALCTQNLPQPTIQNPGKYMDALAYTGTGASNSISSLGFSPDLVWIKNRGTTTSHAIYDTTRGAQSQLSSDTTGDQVTSSSGLTSFDANGFTIGTSTLVNTSGTQYVAWGWDEEPKAGFDIVSYTGNGANRTISHNLGVAPKMIIVKARTTAGADQGWPVWHTSIANTTYLTLSTTTATTTGADYWNSTSPTASDFSLGTNVAVNASNDTYIAYAFAEIEGFSKFGSYVGNANADGTFVWCGFRPVFILIKARTAADAWLIYDNQRNSFNVASTNLVPNTTAADATISGIDFLSSGFKLRTVTTTPNAAQTYIFAAFAEAPFKYARAR
jgi:hypothetical protein